MAYRAVAVDLGATSVRFAEGKFDGSRIEYGVLSQVANAPIESADGSVWSVETLLGTCKSAERHAKEIGATLGVDSWGVDHGFVDAGGTLIQPPACYRDPRHQRVFESHKADRGRLYELTGIQHQPFNTIWQLVARAERNPALKERGVRWLILPELMGHLLGAPAGHELTQASTTQLMGLDGRWSGEALEIAGWPVPEQQPELPGKIVGKTREGVPVVRVGGHDTASAVCGMGALGPNQAFLSVGTWSLLGNLLDEPLATVGAEAANFTNERAVDGRVRFLANIPGFFVINRLHHELGVSETVPEWLSQADLGVKERIDLRDPALFSPASMVEAVRAQLGSDGASPSSGQWAGIALLSLVTTIAGQVGELERVTGRRLSELRVAGGGSASEAFCRCLARASGRSVLAGPQEGTVLGNLGVQFLAQGAIGSFEELGRVISASIEVKPFDCS